MPFVLFAEFRMRFSVYLSRHDVQAMWGGVVSAKKGSTKAVSWADPDFSQSIHPDVGCFMHLSAHDGQCGVLRSVPNKRYQSISQSDSKKLMLSQKSTSVAPCTKVHTMSNRENRAEQAKGLHTTTFVVHQQQHQATVGSKGDCTHRTSEGQWRATIRASP